MRMGEAHPKQSKAHSMAKAGYISLAVESPEGAEHIASRHCFDATSAQRAFVRMSQCARCRKAGSHRRLCPALAVGWSSGAANMRRNEGAWQRPPSDSWGGPHTQTNSTNEQSVAIHKTRGKGSSFCKGDRHPTPRTLAKGIADPRKPSPSPTNRSYESTADKYGA